MFQKEYAIGVCIEGKKARLGLFEKDYIRYHKPEWELIFPKREKTETWTVEFSKDSTEEDDVLKKIADSIIGKIAVNKIDWEDVIGIGISVPGLVDSNGKVTRCVNLEKYSNWESSKNINDELLKELLSLRIKSDGFEYKKFRMHKNFQIVCRNDASAAAVGEKYAGVIKENKWKNVVVVTIGTGIGGGILIDGKLVSGVSGDAGEIGHIQVCSSETVECSCGKKGCLEQYCSSGGILHLKTRMISDGKISEHQKSSDFMAFCKIESVKELFKEDSSKENGYVAFLVDQYCSMFAKALSAITCVINPEAFVFIGDVPDVSKKGNFEEKMKAAFVKYPFPTGLDKTEFIIGKLKEDAGIYGAVYLLDAEKKINDIERRQQD